MNFEKLIPVIRRLALEAGDKIMDIYNSPEFEVKTKSDASPVTEADEAADAIISAGLRAEFPDVILVTGEQADSHAAKGETFLIVDPLGDQRIHPPTRRFYREYCICRKWCSDTRCGLCAR